LDGYMGALVALFIVVSGVQLILSTADPLLGQAPDSALVREIRDKILAYEGIIGMHDLTVHSYGVGRCFASVHCEVDAGCDILESHDRIDNIERDFERDLGIHLVIHLDPVVVGDARTDALKAQVVQAVGRLYPAATLHDFRVVWGVTHTNVVFDAAVPFEEKDADGEIRRRIGEAVLEIDPKLRAVVTVDRGATDGA
ncbi:MAG: cation diffusion facilitator family transporter, partial [Acutalibacteraceae bacterium]